MEIIYKWNTESESHDMDELTIFQQASAMYTALHTIKDKLRAIDKYGEDKDWDVSKFREFVQETVNENNIQLL